MVWIMQHKPIMVGPEWDLRISRLQCIIQSREAATCSSATFVPQPWSSNTQVQEEGGFGSTPNVLWALPLSPPAHHH